MLDEGLPILSAEHEQKRLRAEDGQAFIQHATGDPSPLYLKLGVDRLLPKLQFVYDI